jgi:group II intron reverse transcriptase/maturase
MLSRYLCIKTLSTKVLGNSHLGGWNESQLRGSVNLEKVWRVTTYKVRNKITKLIYSAYLILDSNSITDNGLFESWFSTRMYRESLTSDSEPCNQQCYGVQRPKYVNGGKLGTMGFPKWRKLYGIRSPVRGLGFKCFSSVSDINVNSCVKLKELMNVNKNNLDLVNDKLIHIVSDLEVLVLAYETIKSKPGNTTPGIDSVTLDKIGLKWFISISKLLKAGKYRFKPARRIYVPKSGKKTKRPLTISGSLDKVVQQAIYFILNAIYEPSFLDASHGSRSNRGTHTALKYLKFKFNSVKWCIEADIENNFPSISHSILLKTLKERISCQKFLALIKNSIKAGYKHESKFYESNVGVFQGSVISPILNNIYLHKFDLFMEDLCKSFNLGTRCRKNPEYRQIQYLMSTTNDPIVFKRLCRELWKVDSKDLFDPNFKRLIYVRYVDDFVVGVIGSRKEAADVQEKIRCFLKNHLELTLSDQKTLITHFSKKPIFFLGTFIRGNWEKNKRIKIVVRSGVRRKVKITSRVVLLVPILKLFEKATLNGFFKKRGVEFVPTKVGRLINLDHSDILRYYSSVIRGIMNYYSFANNRKSLGNLVHGLKFSCARTLALKYKLRHASKVFRRFGTYLKCPKTGEALYIPRTFKAIKTFGVNIPLPDSALFSNWNNKLTKSNLFQS